MSLFQNDGMYNTFFVDLFSTKNRQLLQIYLIQYFLLVITDAHSQCMGDSSQNANLHISLYNLLHHQIDLFP